MKTEEHRSPVRLLLMAALLISLPEAGIMALFHLFPDMPALFEAMADSVVLTVLVVPVLYFFMFRPLASTIAAETDAKNALRESEEKYRRIFENVQDVFFQADLNGAIIEISPSIERFGYIREQLIGTSVLDVYADFEERAAFARTVIEHGQVNDYELQVKTADGRVVDTSVSAHVYLGPDGTPVGLEGILRDISDRKRFEAQLTHAANYDPLTNLPNRRRFDEELERHLAPARWYTASGALLFMDLDLFKDVNDGLGHLAGDELLRSSASLLRQQLRETDVIARTGGDEFAILLPGATSEQASTVAKKLLTALRTQTFVAGGHDVNITASIGITLFPEHGETAAELLSRADLAMYQAKEAGRDRFNVHAPADNWQAEIEARLNWRNRIHKALEEDHLLLYAQPILDLSREQVSQYELLLRMEGAEGEILLPDVFLPIAERSGSIQGVERWVIRQAIRLLAEHHREGIEPCVEVNLCGRALGDLELLDIIRHELSVTGVNPANLVVEVTETTAVANMPEAQAFVMDLKDLGCRFALDDFGTGFSSFYLLKHLPVDFLKIDGSFIRDIVRNDVDRHLVRAMVEMAHGLGMSTIGEHVEDEQTLRLLRELGVDYAQGFHIGSPREASEVLSVFARRSARAA